MQTTLIAKTDAKPMRGYPPSCDNLAFYNFIYDLVYFLIFIPFVTLGWILFEEYRK